MIDFARDKKVLEASVKKGDILTNGETKGYTGSKGFAYFKTPGTVTVDLEQVHPIMCIRFLLWDGLGSGGSSGPDSRRYGYRLAVSKDNSRWLDLFSTKETDAIGWQIFYPKSAIYTRYIRIYGLHHTKGNEFHIVAVEAHNEVPPKPDGFIDKEIYIQGDSDRDIKVDNQEGEIEESDRRLSAQSEALERDSSVRVPDERGGESRHRQSKPQARKRLDSAELKKIASALETSPIDPVIVEDIKARFDDLTVLDQNLEAIRREIVGPVTDEIKRSNRLAVTTLIFAIITLFLTIIFSTPGGKKLIDDILVFIGR